MKEKIVFFGVGPYVAPIIEALNKNFNLALVVTTEFDANDPVLSFCSKNDIKAISLARFNSHIIEQIKGVGARIAVLAYFGIIVPQKVLELFEMGIINIHPSLLPKYRGATPGQAAILAGDKTTGVSIIKLDEEVDHGPILMSIDQSIDTFDTSDSLYKKLFQKGAQLLIEVLPKYISGKLKPVEQDHSKATFTERLTRESGFIDINDERHATGDKLDRMIRAYYPWPGVWFRTKLNNVERTVKLFPEEKIQVEGKNVMKLSDFANGYPEGKRVLEYLNLQG